MAYTVTSMEILHHLMYDAFIEIRYRAHEKDDEDNGIYKLSDLFHNLPNKLARVIQSDLTYDEVLQDLREIAEWKGASAWLEQSIARIKETLARLNDPMENDDGGTGKRNE